MQIPAVGFSIMRILAALTAAANFMGAASVDAVRRPRLEADGRQSAELRSAPSHRPENVERFANAVRKH